MSTAQNNSNFFTTNGAVPPDSPAYVKRSADAALLDLALNGKSGYICAGPQMGKSSLMVHTARQLQEHGVRPALIYLTSTGAGTNEEQWYLGLIMRLKLQLKLTGVETKEWWNEQLSLKPAERFAQFLQQIVLAEVKEPLVIFIDEVEAALKLNFYENFFSTLQSIDDTRSGSADRQRLSFFLFGTALPSDWPKIADLPLFKRCEKLNLADFTPEEARTLQPGLQPLFADQTEPVFARILYWTNGHPYLTQKLALAVSEAGRRGSRIDEGQVEKFVDTLVKRQFFSSAANSELHLQSVRAQFKQNSQRRLLALYRRVYAGKEVPEDKESLDQDKLKLIGLVRAENGRLQRRNQIYHQIFKPNSIYEKEPSPWTPYLMRAGLPLAALVILFVVGLAGFSLYQQRLGVLASQAQDLAESFRESDSPDTRLVSLAALFRLGAQNNQAQQLFYELSPADQLALFESIDSNQRGADLITAIRGLYTSPALENNQQNNDLLETMAQPLKNLDHTSHPGVIDLELEITNWLRGRSYYAEGQYRQAIGSYNVSLSLNSDNPNLYFDRGMAYVALGDGRQGLADMNSALNLDRNWRARVQQALLEHDQLYEALWVGDGEYQALAQLVPTPTATPVPPTETPSPTPTPSPTQAPRILPTATATPLPTPTVASVPILLFPPVEPTPIPSPTSSISTGSFTLIAPVSGDEPSFGLTSFEWAWSGPLPEGYGFEVRVWREGSPPLGAHNAVLDNQNGNVEHLGGDRYRLTTNIMDAAGVKQRSGEYLWTVALVQVSPNYADLGQQAPPANLRYAAPSSSGGGSSSGDGGKGGGSVGID